MLKVWGRRNSINVQKVLWLVAELGVAHEHIDAGGPAGGLNTPEFRALNPNGWVPVIEDNGFAVWESHTILRYLAATYGEDQFWSEAPAWRSLAERWMDWCQTALQPDFIGGVFWGHYRTPPAQRNGPAIAARLERCAGHFRFLDRWLERRDFILGEEFSLADIPAGTMLYRYFTLDIERPSVPHVEAWYERLCERPAYRDHVMLPYEDLRGRLDY